MVSSILDLENKNLFTIKYLNLKNLNVKSIRFYLNKNNKEKSKKNIKKNYSFLDFKNKKDVQNKLLNNSKFNNNKFTINNIGRKWKVKSIFFAHLGIIRALDVIESSGLVVSGSDDRTMKLWDFNSNSLIITLTGHIDQIMDIASCEYKPIIFSGSLDKVIKIWSTDELRVVKNMYGHKSGVYSLSLDENLSILSTGSRDCSVKVWDLSTGCEIHTFSGHTNTVTAIKILNDFPVIISGSLDGTVKYWDIRTGRCFYTLNFQGKGIVDIKKLFGSDSIYILTSNVLYDLRIKKNKIETTEILSTSNKTLTCIDSNNSIISVLGDNTGVYYIWNNLKNKLQTKLTSKNLFIGDNSNTEIVKIKLGKLSNYFISSEGDKSLIFWKYI